MRVPNDTQRTVIIGRTGSGKTRGGVWVLGLQDFTTRPWVIVDFKGEVLFDRLGAKAIKVTDHPPKKPGLYLMRLLPHQLEELEAFFWRVHKQRNVGVFIDEGAMLGDGRAFRAILSQGRSKHIPMIVLTQRPVRMSLSVFSEADFFMVYQLNYSKDHQRVVEYIGDRHRTVVNQELPAYCSLWYDVGLNELTKLAPVPDDVALVGAFKMREARGQSQRMAV